MIASVLIEHNVKSLDKTFDYVVPENLSKDISVGHKVLVPFGSQIVEGFVLNLSNKYDPSMEYKEVINIVEKTFCLNEELLELGKFISDTTLSTRISAYQAMFPKALKASVKANINIKKDVYVSLNKEMDVDNYIVNHKKNKKEIEILNLLKEKDVLRKKINSPSLRKLIENNVVVLKSVEVNRNIDFVKEEKKNIELTPEQNEAYTKIKNSTNNKVLLYGVTGSGKTEIYIKLINDTLNSGKNVIMLVPEISLTPQIVNRFLSEFGSRVAVLHSALSEGEKYDEYRRIVNKEVNIVVGARSAVFAPLLNIGLIIIDECSSPSFKQDVNPKYNAIDVSFERAKTHNALVLMGSATPLLEQFARGEKGVFELVKLTKRISNNLPNYILVDMNDEVKKRNYVISSVLKDKINETLKNGKQTILLLNRRGYSTFMSCSSCGYVWKCPNCDISLIYHKTTNNLRCHYCGYATNKKEICPSCGSKALSTLGIGTEKIEEELNKYLPAARVIRMDFDTTRTKGSYEKILAAFAAHEADILIGTQMIVKGHDFPDVTLMGIVAADLSLNAEDYRCAERTFQLLCQAVGRGGRGEKPGEAVIQTYHPDHYSIQAAAVALSNRDLPSVAGF
mgnify:CR=1 FL=1